MDALVSRNLHSLHLQTFKVTQVYTPRALLEMLDFDILKRVTCFTVAQSYKLDDIVRLKPSLCIQKLVQSKNSQ